MYKVTWLRLVPGKIKLDTIATPSLDIAIAVRNALKIAGVHTRFWEGNTLHTPDAPVIQAWEDLLDTV